MKNPLSIINNLTWFQALNFLCVLSFSLTACDKPTDGYEIPTTYDFSNVSYTGQTQRLDMLAEMKSYMDNANSSGTEIESSVLLNMFANENAPFSENSLNQATKQLKNKCFSLDADLFEGYMLAIAAASASQVVGSNGVAGVVTSTQSPDKSYLLDANGVELAQLIEKGLMTAVAYYQITSVYLSDDKIGPSVDNTNVTNGEGTDMEHHWDEAFGYFGVSDEFPAVTSDIRYLGKYSNTVDAVLGTNALIMDAYLTGRAAISNKDMETKSTQVEVLRTNLEMVLVGAAIHYLNSAKSVFADDALRCHALSEAKAFISGLKYNPSAVISAAQIEEVLTALGTNFYEITDADINASRDLLASIYNLDNLKTAL